MKLYIYPIPYDEHKERRVQQVQGAFQRDTHFDEKKFCILIRAEVEKLKEFAAKNEFKMLLDAKKLKEIAKDNKFSIPYPRDETHDIIMKTAIPEDRTWNPFYCKSITSGLEQDEIDLIPYGK
jgi:hypothetical protein